jgi:hypothetical protein
LHPDHKAGCRGHYRTSCLHTLASVILLAFFADRVVAADRMSRLSSASRVHFGRARFGLLKGFMLRPPAEDRLDRVG